MTEMRNIRQEPEDIHGRPLLRPTAIAIVAGVLGLALAWVLTPAGYLRDQPAPEGEIDGVDRDPIESSVAGRSLQQRDRAALDRWEWVDRERGLVNIPIDRAIELVVAREAEAAP